MRRAAIVALTMLLGSCTIPAGEHVSFNVHVEEGPSARAEVRQIGESLAALGPMMLYDRRHSTLNVYLMQTSSFRSVAATVASAGFKAAPGLRNPSPEFLRRTRCTPSKPCHDDEFVQCTVTARVPYDRYKSLFSEFGKEVVYGAYPIMGDKFLRVEGSNDVTISLAFYQDCDVAESEASEVWSRASGGENIAFHVQQDG